MPRIKKQSLKIGDIVYTTERGWGHGLQLYSPLEILMIEPCDKYNLEYTNERVIVCRNVGAGKYGLMQSIPESTLRRWNHETQISPSGSVKEASQINV